MEEGRNTEVISKEELDVLLKKVENGEPIEIEDFSIINPLIKQLVALEKLQEKGLVKVTTELELNYVVTVKGI